MNQSSSLASWLVFELIVCLIAASGGILVFCGLWIEKKAGKKWYGNVGDLRTSEAKSERGWNLLMWGIALEIIVAFVFAARDGWEIRQIHLQIAQNDPRNMPLANASAMARLIITENPKSPLSSLLNGEDPIGWRSSVRFLVQSNAILGLEGLGTEVNVWEMGSSTNREWRLHFHEDLFNFLSSEEDRNKVFVRQFDKVDSFILTMPFPTNSIVESGSIVLTVNELKWTFQVPRQRPKWGVISMHKVKDNEGHITAEVMRVPIVDFVFPPRFTNRWYDGQ